MQHALSRGRVVAGQPGRLVKPRVAAVGLPAQHGQDLGRLGAGDGQAAGDHGPGLVQGDVGQGRADDGGMVEADGREQHEVAGQRRGGVAGAAEAGLVHGGFGPLVGEQPGGHGGQELEIGEPAFFPARGRGGEHGVCGRDPVLFGQLPAGHEDAFAHADEVRRQVQSRGQTVGGQHGGQKAAVEPLPLVPTTWTARWGRLVRARAARAARIRSGPRSMWNRPRLSR